MRRVSELRSAVQAAVTAEDLVQVFKMLLRKAIKEGDVTAARELLDRCLGKPKVHVDVKQRPSLDELRARVVSILSRDPNALRRLLGDAAPILPILPTSNPAPDALTG